MTAPRVLVAAKRLDPEASSEGICSARFVHALLDHGVPVTVLTGDEAASEASLREDLPWLTGPLRHCSTLPDPPAGAVRRRLRAAVDLAGTAVRGHPTWYERSVRAWRRAIGDALAEDRPDVLTTRGAGGGFEPHLAVLDLDPDVPWIANYHDPWPASRWPDPYRAPRTRAMRLQERGHQRILQRADALTFPSPRLRDWVVGDDERLRGKSYVVPHAMDASPCAGEVDAALTHAASERPFTLVHTGTLLRHRRVDALLDALATFIGRAPERQAATRLVLAGPLADGGDDPPARRSLEAAGVLHWHRARINRATAQALVGLATASVLVEAAGDESPFFPSKLTDYFAAGRPVLALTPHRSVASDLMGADHQLLVEPDDPTGIEAALERLWTADQEHRLDTLTLPATTTTSLEPAAVADAFATVLDDLRTGRGR